MSELGEDFRAWPKNPYELLDVEEGVEKKTLKRAYNKLIRRFKPDHFPEQFRRIREAYDEILEEMDRDAFFARFNEEENTDSEPDGETKNEIEESFDKNSELWAKAIDGGIDEALEEFQLLFKSKPDSETAIRLYWLKKIQGRSHEELAGLLIESLAVNYEHRLANLLYRELEYCEELILSSEYLEFLRNLAAAEPSSLRQFLDRRWETVYKLGQFSVIGSDIESLRSEVAFVSEEEWALMLVNVHNYISFAKGSDIEEMLKKYHKEVDSIPVSSGSYLDNALDYYEFLREIRKLVRKSEANSMPEEWERIIAGYWTGSERLFKKPLQEEMIRWCIDPVGILDLFDRVSYNNRALIYAQVKKIVYSYSVNQGPYIFMVDQELVKKRCARFLKHREGLRYPVERKRILEFCLNEDVPPDALCEYIVENRLGEYRWVMEVSEDIHQAVYMACKSVLSYAEFEDGGDSA